MKNICEYLLGKNKKLESQFPKEPFLEDIVEFLKVNEFIEIEDDAPTLRALLDKIKKAAKNNSVYVVSIEEDTKDVYIRFVKQGKITSKNPIFACLAFSREGSAFYMDDDVPGWIEVPNNRLVRSTDNFNTYEEFRKAVQKHFNW